MPNSFRDWKTERAKVNYMDIWAKVHSELAEYLFTLEADEENQGLRNHWPSEKRDKINVCIQKNKNKTLTTEVLVIFVSLYLYFYVLLWLFYCMIFYIMFSLVCLVLTACF